jgi:hypothetical protein
MRSLPGALPAIPSSPDEASRLRLDVESLAQSVEQLRQVLKLFGFGIVDLGTPVNISISELADLATRLLAGIGQPLRIFATEPTLWREVGVDTSRPPNRSRGVGHLPLHIDFVNTEYPPELMALLCIRPDPNGGGQSLGKAHQ